MSGRNSDQNTMKTRLSSILPFAALTFVLLLPVVALLDGCATLDPNADPLVVRTEQIQRGADATFDFVLHVDNADRGFWRTNAPAFHTFCEGLRTMVPYGTGTIQRVLAAELNVQQLKVRYKTNRDSGNSNALFQASSALSTLVVQANSWSNIVTLPVH